MHLLLTGDIKCDMSSIHSLDMNVEFTKQILQVVCVFRGLIQQLVSHHLDEVARCKTAYLVIILEHGLREALLVGGK